MATNSNEIDNVLDSNSNEKNIEQIRNISNSVVKQSGNSDVDVQIDVHIDNSAIAYAILCSLYATNQMNIQEFNTSVRMLKDLIGKEDNIYRVINSVK